MRGKLRDKRDVKADRLRRETPGRRTSRRDNRNLHLALPLDDAEEEEVLEQEGQLATAEERQS